VAASAPTGEEVTGAMPVAVLESQSVGIMIAPKGDSHLLESDTVAFLSVALGLLDLADQARVHALLLLPFFIPALPAGNETSYRHCLTMLPRARKAKH
jgi:hypothetical protein